MLTIIGNLEGETYKEATPISAAKIATAFKIKLPTQTDPKQIKVLGGRTDKFGQRLSPSSISVPTKIQVFHPDTGESAEITLKRSGVDKLSQSKYRIRGENIAFDVKKAEDYVFLALHPMCKQSPVRQPHQKALYELFDASAVAAAQYDVFLRRADIQSEIFTAPFASIQARAYGVNIGNERADTSGDEIQTRVSLIRLLEKDPAAFIKQWSSNQTKSDGTLRTGILKGWIDQAPVDGQAAWVWKATGDLIVKIKSDADSFRTLAAYANENPALFSRLEAMIGGSAAGAAQASNKLAPPPPPEESVSEPAGEKASFNSFAARAIRLGLVTVLENGDIEFMGETIYSTAADPAVSLQKWIDNPANIELAYELKDQVRKAKNK